MSMGARALPRSGTSCSIGSTSETGDMDKAWNQPGYQRMVPWPWRLEEVAQAKDLACLEQYFDSKMVANFGCHTANGTTQCSASAQDSSA
jgi:hypothetical protein